MRIVINGSGLKHFTSPRGFFGEMKAPCDPITIDPTGTVSGNHTKDFFARQNISMDMMWMLRRGHRTAPSHPVWGTACFFWRPGLRRVRFTEICYFATRLGSSVPTFFFTVGNTENTPTVGFSAAHLSKAHCLFSYLFFFSKEKTMGLWTGQKETRPVFCWESPQKARTNERLYGSDGSFLIRCKKRNIYIYLKTYLDS